MGEMHRPADNTPKRVRKDGQPYNRKPRSASSNQNAAEHDATSMETGLPRRSLYDLFASGKLPAVRLSSKDRSCLNFKRSDVVRLIERSTIVEQPIEELG